MSPKEQLKLILNAVLTVTAVLLLIPSCATVLFGPEGTSFSLGKKEPSNRGELRLLSMDIPQSGNLSANVEYWAMINFEADPQPDIRRVCFNFSGASQSCVDVRAKDVTYGLRSYLRVPIHIPVGSKRIDCYAEYIREGRTHRTNAVTYYIIILKKPEE